MTKLSTLALAAAMAASAASAAAQHVSAQERYPSRPIALILPYAAGGGKLP